MADDAKPLDQPPRCLAIVPAFNERDAIGGVIADLQTSANVDVLVVDDGSGDGTAAVAVAAGARVVTLPVNLGIGAAVQTGYAVAQDGDYDIAIQDDGDGQHPATEIAVLIEALAATGADVVIGSRFLGTGEFRSTRARRAGIGVFAKVVSAAVGVPLTDTTSGFRAVGRRGIALYAAAYPHDYPEVEATVMLHKHRLRSREVAVTMRERQAGVSSITTLRSIYYMVKVLLSIGVAVFRRNAVPLG